MSGPIYILSLSGGKDSAAASLYLHEQGIEHRRVFADTGWEHKDTLAYIRDVLEPQLGPIDVVQNKRGGMVELIEHWDMFPSGFRRWCTRELKVKPLNDYIFGLIAETGRPAISVVGVRAGESHKRSTLPEWDGYVEKRGQYDIWRPLIAWTEEQVIEAHHRHNVPPNPLYLAGASRVGCWPCIYARKKEIRLVADTDPKRIELIERLEARVSDAATKRHGEPKERTFFQARGPASHGGKDAFMPIRKVVEWSRTSAGGVQYEMFPPPDDEGCLRWGMCERAK